MDREQIIKEQPLLAEKLKTVFDPEIPVYVEAESKKIGRISLPGGLFDAMHASPCLRIEVPMDIRVHGLLEDYQHYIDHPEQFIENLQPLHRFHGAKQLDHWNEMIRAGDFLTMVGELLTLHYDPSYSRAITGHYVQLDNATPLELDDLSENSLKKIAATF